MHFKAQATNELVIFMPRSVTNRKKEREKEKANLVILHSDVEQLNQTFQRLKGHIISCEDDDDDDVDDKRRRCDV